MVSLPSSLSNIFLSYKYSYSIARIKAMKSFLLSDRQFTSIIEAKDVEDAVDILNNTIYGPLISDTIREGFLATEGALNKNLVDTLVKISKFLPGNIKEVFSDYLTKYEVANIKSILRGIFAKAPKEEITRSLLPISLNIKESIYDDLVGLETIEEVVSRLEGTIYGDILKEVLPEYEKNEILLPLEASMDNFVYENLWMRLSSFKGPDIELLKKAIGTEIDIINIKVILRSIADGVKAKEMVKYLIPNGHELDPKRLEAMCKVEDIEGVINALERTSYYEPLSKSAGEYKKTGRLSIFEGALDSYYTRLGREFRFEQPLGIGPIWGYVISKVAEIHELIRVLKLKVEGFSPEEIKSLA